MEVRRTAPLKLGVPDEYHDDLHETADQFLYCANEASDYCWDGSVEILFFRYFLV